MIPCHFKNPVTISANGLLPDDLREEHAARPAPDFLSCQCIGHFEVVRLAAFERHRQQFLGGVDHGESELCSAGYVRGLHIQRWILFGNLRDIIGKRFRLLLLRDGSVWLRERRRALRCGLDRLTLTHINAGELCDRDILTGVHTRFDNAETSLERDIQEIHFQNELLRQA